MTQASLVIPPNVTELKQQIGEGILVASFAMVRMSTPETALRQARNGNNVEAANAALAQYQTGLVDLGHAAERALQYLPSSFDTAALSFTSDIAGSFGGARDLIRDIPGGYLGRLVIQAFNGEDDFRRVMELFRDLANSPLV